MSNSDNRMKNDHRLKFALIYYTNTLLTAIESRETLDSTVVESRKSSDSSAVELHVLECFTAVQSCVLRDWVY